MQLYNLSKAYNELWEMVEDPEMDLECLEDTISGIEGDIENKAENIVKFMRSLEAYEAAIKKEEDNLTAKRKTLENRRERLKGYLDTNLRTMGIKELSAGIFKLKYQKSPPSVRADEANEGLKACKRFWVQHPDTLDKKGLLEALKAGEIIPGAEISQGDHLRIR